MSPQVFLVLCLILIAATVVVTEQNLFLERYVVFPFFAVKDRDRKF